jgi:hypothetical protein
MLTQRVFQIAAGYEDANDCDTLRDDMILKICSEVLPESGNSLSSQPTMSRFENSLSRSELYKLAVAFVDNFIQSYSEEPPVIILDPDRDIWVKNLSWEVANPWRGQNFLYIPIISP